MPDLTMCDSLVCDKRMQCYRWIAKADPIQSFSKFSSCNQDNNFPDFIQATEQEIKKYKEREGIK